MLLCLFEQASRIGRRGSLIFAGRRFCLARRFRLRVAAEQPRQTFIERFLHRNPVVARHNHAAQFGDFARLRPQVKRLDVNQRLFNRNHHQRSENHARAALIPERQLTRDFRVLIDAGDDLFRTENELLFREAIRRQATVILAVRAGDHPRREIVFALRRERQHQDKFFFLLARQFHNRVIRLHLPRFFLIIRAGRLGNRPLVFLVVEFLRFVHLIRRKNAGLQQENVFRVTQVRPQTFRHFPKRFQRVRKNFRVGLNNRVGSVGDVKINRAVISVNRCFDRIANVIDAVGRLRIRVTVGRRVGIGDPD